VDAKKARWSHRVRDSHEKVAESTAQITNFRIRTTRMSKKFTHNTQPFVQAVRSRLGNSACHAILIFEGPQSHMLQVIDTFAAQYSIRLFLLPSHTSHLSQPLDQFPPLWQYPVSTISLSSRIFEGVAVLERSRNSKLF
jgi:hypothetical protein